MHELPQTPTFGQDHVCGGFLSGMTVGAYRLPDCELTAWGMACAAAFSLEGFDIFICWWVWQGSLLISRNQILTVRSVSDKRPL